MVLKVRDVIEMRARDPPPPKSQRPLDLDDVLVAELGQFGRYQVRVLALLALPCVLLAVACEFVFSAADIPYR
ncbi:hypothetical protein JYU34_017775 [Plutella xylostella]|uniref:Uncharacterized protein n=1 Tax=Plutella xylostella TaxID=51655 RepID=A0ABQ7Q1Y0_PLUXY|nr:hypothetical protein JYU34_017775 [Plutella xylostella]